MAVEFTVDAAVADSVECITWCEPNASCMDAFAVVVMSKPIEPVDAPVNVHDEELDADAVLGYNKEFASPWRVAIPEAEAGSEYKWAVTESMDKPRPAAEDASMVVELTRPVEVRVSELSNGMI